MWVPWTGPLIQFCQILEVVPPWSIRLNSQDWILNCCKISDETGIFTEFSVFKSVREKIFRTAALWYVGTMFPGYPKIRVTIDSWACHWNLTKDKCLPKRNTLFGICTPFWFLETIYTAAWTNWPICRMEYGWVYLFYSPYRCHMGFIVAGIHLLHTFTRGLFRGSLHLVSCWSRNKGIAESIAYIHQGSPQGLTLLGALVT